MSILNKPRWLFILALLVAGYLLVSPARVLAQTPAPDSEEANQLLSEAKVEAHELEFDAEHMEKFPRSNLNRETHALKLNELREHVNNCGRTLAKLQDVRETASPWQQKAIDEITPLLKELAANTRAAIEHFNDTKHSLRVNTAKYEAYLVANHAVAKELAALIDDYLAYGKHKTEFERFKEKLMAAER